MLTISDNKLSVSSVLIGIDSQYCSGPFVKTIVFDKNFALFHVMLRETQKSVASLSISAEFTAPRV